MKLLKEYLSTKVKVKSGFPTKPKCSDIIRFLKENGFVEVKISSKIDDYYKIINIIKKKIETDNIYIVEKNRNGKKNDWIRFIKCGKLNNDNPIFFINVTEDGSEFHCQLCNDKNAIGFVDSSGDSHDAHVFFNYSDFVDEVNRIYRL